MADDEADNRIDALGGINTTMDIIDRFGGSEGRGLTWKSDAITLPDVEVLPEGTELIDWPAVTDATGLTGTDQLVVCVIAPTPD